MSELRRARVIDPHGRPSGSRPPVPPEDAERILAYLENAPIVLAARGYDDDAVDPSHGAKVPMTFHTDGEWIWPGAVAYYLRTHGIPPEPDLVAHIRQRGFEIAEVDDHTRDAAVSVLIGAPTAGRPGRPAAPPAGQGAESRQRELAAEAARARDRAALGRLRRRLDELGADPAVYRLGEVDDDSWCLIHEGGVWSVFWSERGGRHNEAGFATADQAGAYLLGTLLIVPSRMRAPDRTGAPAGTASASETPEAPDTRA